MTVIRVFGAASCLVFSAAAFADSPGENAQAAEWRAFPFEQTVVYERYDHGRNKVIPEEAVIRGVALATTAADRPLTVLSCAPEVGLSVKVTGRPRSLDDIGVYAGGRRKSSYGKVFVDGDRVRANEWSIDTYDGSMASFDAMTVAHIYDAAMKGLIVRLDLENRSAFDIHLPAANDQFPKFVEACPFLDTPAE